MVRVTCEAPDDKLLLVEWLNALVYEIATRKMLFSLFSVRIDHDTLPGKAWGEDVDTTPHDPASEMKGATQTEIRVAKDDDHWVAQCVVEV